MRKKRSSNQHGSITVLVTLILIPTIVVNTFFVDLARLKLYGNQAVMAADSYAEAILTVYDDVLKDMYGLFGVANNPEAEKAFATLEKYIASSFNPKENAIGFGHLGGLLDKEQTGFMPYRDAQVKLEKVLNEQSSLRNQMVFNTQVGDFMKFRVAQAFWGKENEVLSVVQTIANEAANSAAIEQKQKFDESIEKLMDETQKYYEAANELAPYGGYLKTVEGVRGRTIEAIRNLVKSERYQAVASYKSDPDAMETASANAAKNGLDSLSDDDKLLAHYYDDVLKQNPSAVEKELKEELDELVDNYERTFYPDSVNFKTFNGLVSDLKKSADKLPDLYQKVVSQKSALESKLAALPEDDDMRKGMEEELKLVDRLYEDPFTVETYAGLATHLENQKDFNQTQHQNAKDSLSAIENVVKTYKDFPIDSATTVENAVWGPSVRVDDYNNFLEHSLYGKGQGLYGHLSAAFQTGGTELDKAKDKRKNAEKEQKDAEKAFNKSNAKTDARSIPDTDEFEMGLPGDGPGGLNIGKLIGGAASSLSSKGVAEIGNELLLKFYMVTYDFSMFSNRLTNKTQPELTEAREPSVSLTGYSISEKLNYLYTAELEYLFGGYKSSQANLDTTRNTILSFRAVVNFAATYRVKEVNGAIKKIANMATAAGHPGLALIIAAALRATVTTFETIEDWNRMMKGEKIALAKSKLGHMTAVTKFADLIDLPSGSSASEKTTKLGYEDYLWVMLLFLTTKGDISQRTADLIELNVNTAKQYSGPGWTLSSLDFKLSETYTAVDATCSVQLDFAIMPDSMLNQFADENTRAILDENEKNFYKFTVTRGY